MKPEAGFQAAVEPSCSMGTCGTKKNMRAGGYIARVLGPQDAQSPILYRLPAVRASLRKFYSTVTDKARVLVMDQRPKAISPTPTAEC